MAVGKASVVVQHNTLKRMYRREEESMSTNPSRRGLPPLPRTHIEAVVLRPRPAQVAQQPRTLPQQSQGRRRSSSSSSGSRSVLPFSAAANSTAIGRCARQGCGRAV